MQTPASPRMDAQGEEPQTRPTGAPGVTTTVVSDAAITRARWAPATPDDSEVVPGVLCIDATGILKPVIAAHTALSWARQGRRVLLLDAENDSFTAELVLGQTTKPTGEPLGSVPGHMLAGPDGLRVLRTHADTLCQALDDGALDPRAPLPPALHEVDCIVVNPPSVYSRGGRRLCARSGTAFVMVSAPASAQASGAIRGYRAVQRLRSLNPHAHVAVAVSGAIKQSTGQSALGAMTTAVDRYGEAPVTPIGVLTADMALIRPSWGAGATLDSDAATLAITQMARRLAGLCPRQDDRVAAYLSAVARELPRASEV